MCRRLFMAAGAMALLFSWSAAAHAQYAPEGYIMTSGWNHLFLVNPNGCGGGGADTMRNSNWVSPHDIAAEDPRAGDDWNDIPALGAGETDRGAPLTDSIGGAKWFTTASLLADHGIDIAGRDEANGRVNYDLIGADINAALDPDFALDNVMSVSTTYVRNLTGGDLVIQICGGSDDSLQILVNNNIAHNNSICRGIAGSGCNDVATWVLPDGVSKITMIVWEEGGGWDGRCGLIVGGELAADGNGMIEYLGPGVPGDGLEGQITDPPDLSALSPNPNGLIQAKAWNLLFPLLNPFGCGGGQDVQATNWVAPRDIRVMDPKAPATWPGIDFGGAATATGYNNGGILEPGVPRDLPIWFTVDLLNGQFPAAGIDGENGLVDYQDMAVRLTDSVSIACEGNETGVGVDNCNDGEDNDGDTLADCDDPECTAVVPGGEPIPNDFVMGIATTYVENLTGAPLDVEICTASDDGVAVYVNCQLATNQSVCRGGSRYGCDELRTAVLAPGVNKIATLTFEQGGGWYFNLGIRLAGTPFNLIQGNGMVDFIGPTGAGTVTPAQDCLERTIENYEFACPNPPRTFVPVTIHSTNGIAAAQDITEVLSGDQSELVVGTNELVVDNVTEGGVVTPTIRDATANTSSSGGDIWQSCDDFQFDYDVVNGDFDLVVEHLKYEHGTGAGRWGKFGPMARFELTRESLFHMAQIHGPDNQDDSRAAGRTAVGGDDGCDTMFEAGSGLGDPRPRFSRIKREGQMTHAYHSNSPGVLADPLNDAHWQFKHTLDWAGALPDDVFVGFANSDHNSNGAVAQTATYWVLPGSTPASLPTSAFIGNDNGGQSGTAFPVPVTTALEIQWTGVDPDVLADGGVSYEVASNIPQTISLSGGTGQGLNTNYAGQPLTLLGDGPEGILENGLDIGTTPTAGSIAFDPGSGSYAVRGSGGDIWDGGDHMHFGYRRWTGDFVATARLVGFIDPPGDRWGRYGIMARYTCDFNSKYSSILQAHRVGLDDSQQDTPRHQSRRNHLENGGTQSEQVAPIGALGSVDVQVGTGCVDVDPNAGMEVCDDGEDNDGDTLVDCDDPECQEGPVLGPRPNQRAHWFRLVRKGKYFYSLIARDDGGEPGGWTVVGGDTVPNAPDALLVGPAVSSHDAGAMEVVFDNFSIAPLVLPPAVQAEVDESLRQTEDFEDPATLGDYIVENGDANAVQVVGGALRLAEDNVGSDRGAVYLPLQGFGLGDVPFQLRATVNYGKPLNDPANTDLNPADGIVIGLYEGLMGVNYPPFIGGGGGAMSWQVVGRDDIPTRRRKSIGVEIDAWNGGGQNEAPGLGSHEGPDDQYHLGLNFNATTTSAQTHVQLDPGSTMPSIYYVDPADKGPGLTLEADYIPMDAATAHIRVTASAEGFGPQVVLEAVGPKLDGDVTLGFMAANGGATARWEVEEASIAPLCLETPDGVSISGDAKAIVGQTASLTASLSGADGAGAYSWTLDVDSSIAVIAGSTTGESIVVQCNGEGVATAKVVANDSTCFATVDDSFAVECAGTEQLPGDNNRDGQIDISDPVKLSEILFLNPNATLPCPASGAFDQGSNLAIFDWDGSGEANLGDIVGSLQWQFLGGAAHALGIQCVALEDCPEAVGACLEP